jgi:hypothetical protein
MRIRRLVLVLLALLSDLMSCDDGSGNHPDVGGDSIHSGSLHVNQSPYISD